jgi:hypothetical protein
LIFERMIARIYESISRRATVKHNDSIPGHDSRINRQIDVSVRFREAGCQFLIIVRAKTNSKPLDVNDIGEFATVVRVMVDVRASKGVLICNAGFSDGAQTLAATLGIDVCSAHDAETKDWRTVLKLPVVWVRLTPVVNLTMSVQLEVGDSVRASIAEWRFSVDAGEKEFSPLDRFTESWNTSAIPKEPGTTDADAFALPAKNLSFFAGNARRPVSELKCSYVVGKRTLRTEVETDEFTGLRNYLSGDLTIATLGVAIPPGCRSMDGQKSRPTKTDSSPRISQS